MSKDSILIVEDDEDIVELLAFNLQSAGFAAETARDGYEGLAKARRNPPAAVILDLMLPGLDGFEVCKELKRDPKTASAPIIMLTARGEEVDRIVGLELGADDYVVKPFSPRELVLRLRSVLKRHAPEPEKRQVLARDGLSVDMAAHRVSLDGLEVALTATEFKLLAELFQSAGRVLTRDRLLNSVWGYEFEGYARTVDTHVRRLRQKLGHFADMIETVRGVGYRFKE
ncbi:MAG: response regulator (CheY-like domain and winged-helix DNA-binding domain containing protein) [Solidesulfovibrio magneticus str. Maddingley MBC34]|uniref:Phosphate regulon transcriptional regulatory protein PhoB n=1 Tax=Solidesulfovibrio magneticus str. Maddingley MBC34 TaxID=1206767 RepID=K6GTX0_9BACT|nr:MAG: response regulator (CheY-like domain and winged-helix DNA-binding domain containing protein) [Solidesulfovibrio magneticus str. Maddingley MBC34]